MIFKPNIGVVDEIVQQSEFWKEKQKDIESKFKDLYKPVPAKKGRKKHVQPHNKELSSYAGSLTKEFLIQVSTLIHSTFRLLNECNGEN